VNVNIALAAAIAALVFVTSGLGGHLASTKPWHKWVFWGFGFLTAILISVQAVLNEQDKPLTYSEAQKLLSENHTQFVLVPPVSPKDTGKPISKAEFETMLRQYSTAATQTKFANITDERLSDRALALYFTIRGAAEGWQMADMIWDKSTEELIGNKPGKPFSKTEIANIRKQREPHRTQIDNENRDKLKPKVLEMCDLRDDYLLIDRQVGKKPDCIQMLRVIRCSSN
jgi:hypothetical protein